MLLVHCIFDYMRITLIHVTQYASEDNTMAVNLASIYYVTISKFTQSFFLGGIKFSTEFRIVFFARDDIFSSFFFFYSLSDSRCNAEWLAVAWCI